MDFNLADIKIQTAIIAASITAVGWLVTHILAIWREDVKHSREALLLHTERQLEELYGPLAFQVYEGRRTFKDLLQALDRSYVFPKNDAPLAAEDLKVWCFWVENDFRPRNKNIKDVLFSKTHLIEDKAMPKSYIDFLDHSNSWEINHARWQLEGIEYNWHSRTEWPEQFEIDIINTFKTLQKRRAGLIKGWSSMRISLIWGSVSVLLGLAFSFL